MNSEPDENRYSVLSSWWFVLLIINAVLGISWLELALRHVNRFRDPPSLELCELFPAYMRRDASGWSRLKLYPGAMFLLIPKFIMAVIILIICCILLRLILLFQDLSRPIRGCRRFLVKWTCTLTIRALGLFSFFTWNRYKYLSHDDVDYTEYLGTNEEQDIHASIGA